MIDSQHHVSLNGVRYRLFESGGEGHYQFGYEPLRPPNAVVVQGAGRQDLFQTRPDVLLWELTDWSGGEGQRKYNTQSANRHAVLNNVDPFSRPGQLLPGPYFEATNDSVDATWNDDQVTLVPVGISGELWAVDTESVTINIYKWDETNERWGAATAMPTAPGASVRDGVDADDDYLYYYDDAGDVYKYDGTTTTKMNSSSLATTTNVVLRELGDYIYLIQPSIGKAWEIVKTATGSTAFTEIDNWNNATGNASQEHFAQVGRGPSRLYVLLSGADGTTTLREIAPSTAAGTGFGKEIAVWKGFQGTSVWYHNGLIFIAGWEIGNDEKHRVLLYLVPGGTYGTFGYVRHPDLENYDGRIVGLDDGSTLLTTQFVVWGTGTTPRVYELDAVEGGMAQIGELPDSGLEILGATRWGGETFLPSYDGTTKRIYRGVEGQYSDGGYAISPWHDMGLSDEKVLSSVVLAVEELPTDWDVKLYYSVDGDTSFTLFGTYSTDGGTGTRYTVSTDSVPVTFRTLRFKIEFDYTGAGVSATAPVVNSLEIRAQLANRTKVWRLRLDLMDDVSASYQAFPGNKKIDNIQSLDTQTVVEFLDGYTDRDSGKYDTYDVLVDSANIVLDRPGEGFAEVVLREMA